MRIRKLVSAAAIAAMGFSGACDDGGVTPPATDLNAQADVSTDASGDSITDTSGDAVDSGPEIDNGSDVDAGPAPLPPALVGATTAKPFETFGEILVQPAIALASDGTATVAFAGRAGSGDLQIFAGQIDAEGAQVTAPVPISEAIGLQNEPASCRLRDGNVVVVWSVDTQSTGPDGENLEVRFRRIDPSGAPMGTGSTRVLTDRPGNHWLGEVACDPLGGFAITGVRPDDTTPAFSVFTQRFDATGADLGQPQDLLDGSDGGQVFPNVAVTSDSHTVTTWEDTANINTPQEQTVIGLRTEASDGTLGPFIAAFTGANVQRPVVSASGVSNAVLAAATVDQKVALALLSAPDASSVTPIAFDPEPGVPTYNAQLVATGTDDSWFVVYYRGLSGTVAVHVARVDINGAILDGPVQLSSGNIPSAYPPALAYAHGRLVVTWTVGLGSGQFGLRSAHLGQ